MLSETVELGCVVAQQVAGALDDGPVTGQTGMVLWRKVCHVCK